MRREFTIQLYDRIDPDVCLRGDCQGPAPAPSTEITLAYDVQGIGQCGDVIAIFPEQCPPCARRRLGLSARRTSAWWRTEPTTMDCC